MKRQRKSQPNGKSSSKGPALSHEQAARAKKTRKSKQQEGSGEEVKIVLQYFKAIDKMLAEMSFRDTFLIFTSPVVPF